MTAPVKPWSNHRKVLWAIGALGLLLLAFGLLVAWFLQGGFGPGKQTSPPGLTELCVGLLLGIPCVYYIIVAHRPWSRKLWIVGVAIHSVLLALFLFAVIKSSGAAFLALPFLLVGPVTWLLYAKRNTFSEQSG
jgi:hypothetical protein